MANDDAGGVPAALAAQHEVLAGLLDGLSEVDWARPSRCEGWSVADVVMHVAQTDELAVASLAGRLAEGAADLGWATASGGTVDELADRAVADARAGRGAGAAVGSRWRAEASVLRDALAAREPGGGVQRWGRSRAGRSTALLAQKFVPDAHDCATSKVLRPVARAERPSACRT